MIFSRSARMLSSSLVCEGSLNVAPDHRVGRLFFPPLGNSDFFYEPLTKAVSGIVFFSSDPMNPADRNVGRYVGKNGRPPFDFAQGRPYGLNIGDNVYHKHGESNWKVICAGSIYRTT
jgi:hypothetical protein